MLFHSSIRRELARNFGATLVALATIVMTIMLIRTLGLANRGAVNPSEVMLVMGFTVLGHLPTLLTLSLFIAIVSTLSRMQADSEMVIWFGAGRGLAGFLAPLFRFAWPVLLAVVLLALLVWPWSNQQIQDLRDRYEKRGDIERVAPGQFQESADGSRVFFVDKDSPGERQGSNVFISSVEQGKAAVISARGGRIETIQGERFLVLNDGQRIETPRDGSLEVQVSEFAEYGVRIRPGALAMGDAQPGKAVPTLDLLKMNTPPFQAELSWRLGLALAASNLVVLALVVSSVNPRASRSGNLVMALLTFVVYYNLINLGQAWIAQGRVGLGAYLLALHGGALVLALAWLAARHRGWSVRALFVRRAAAREVR